MVRIANDGCEDDALGRHAALRRRLQHLGMELGIGFAQPQHRVRHVAQQGAPGVESLRAELVGVVEGAHHEGPFGQPGLGPRHGLGQRALGAIGLQGQRQQGQLLAVVGGQFQRRDQGVAHDVVDAGHARAAREPQVAGLHRRGLAREDAGPRAARVAHQVDQQVDAVGADALSGLRVRQALQFNEVVSRAHRPLAQRRPVVGAAGIQPQLEALAVDLFQHRQEQLRHRVVAKVEGHQAQTDARAGPLRWQHRRQRLQAMAQCQGVALCGFQVQRRRQRQRQQAEGGGHHRPSGWQRLQQALQLLQVGVEVGPVAQVALFQRQARQRFQVVGLQGQHRLDALHRLALEATVAADVAQQAMAAHQRRVFRQGAQQHRRGLFVAAQGVQQGCVLQHGVRFRVPGPFQGTQGLRAFDIAVQTQAAVAHQAQGLRAVCIQPHGLARGVQRPGQFASLAQGVGQIDPVQAVERRRPRGTAKCLCGQGPVAGLHMRQTPLPVALGPGAGRLGYASRRAGQGTDDRAEDRAEGGVVGSLGARVHGRDLEFRLPARLPKSWQR